MEVVTLNISEKEFNKSIYSWYICEDMYDEEGIYYEPNLNWKMVKIKRDDVNRYLDFYAKRLECSLDEKLKEDLTKELELMEVH